MKAMNQKQNEPVHLVVEAFQRDISKLIKTLNRLNKTSNWKDFNRCQDLLESVYNSVFNYVNQESQNKNEQ